jgi:predicted dehydrogenase
MQKLTRRNFVKSSLIAASALSLGGRKVLGANDEIRVGVVGIRSKGAHLIEAFHALDGVRVVALCDVDQRILDREAAKFEQRGDPVEKYADVRKLLDNRAVDAVAIATPNHWHSLIGIWACQAGKDVYVEKPVSHSAWEGRKLVEAARKYNRIVQAGTQNRSDTGFREAIEYLRRGNLGKVQWAHGLWYRDRAGIGRVAGPQPIPPSVDYDLWCGPALMEPLLRPNLHYDWHWFWNTGNGDMGNLGNHQIDDCCFALGLGYPKRVISYGGRFSVDDNAQTPNTQIAIFDYPDFPVIIEIRNLFHSKEAKHMDHFRGVRDGGNVIHCEEGYFAGGRGGGWVYDLAGKRVKQFPGDGGEEHPANFVACMRSRKHGDLHAEIEQGHISAALCHMANASYRLSRPASLSQCRSPLSHPAVEEAHERLLQHLLNNGISPRDRGLSLGPWLEIDAAGESFRGAQAKAGNHLLKRRKYRKPFVVPDQV